FSISLALALVFLGVVARGLENGRHRALAAVLLAATALCHVIPTFFALAGAGVLILHRMIRLRGVAGAVRAAVPVSMRRRRLAWAVPIGAAVLLAGSIMVSVVCGVVAGVAAVALCLVIPLRGVGRRARFGVP